MTPEQQRILIAKACGWKPYKPITDDGWPLLMTPPESPNKEGWLETIPDYLNDLNAIHEAEDMLDGDQWETWWQHMRRILPEYYCYRTGRITAAQRAEAFLKTINLWDSQPCSTEPS